MGVGSRLGVRILFSPLFGPRFGDVGRRRCDIFFALFRRFAVGVGSQHATEELLAGFLEVEGESEDTVTWVQQRIVHTFTYVA